MHRNSKDGDKASTNSDTLACRPVGSGLKRQMRFESDTAGIKPKRSKTERLSSYIHESKWIHEQYSDLELIGKGAFGLVYKAVSRSNPGREVAIKEILRNSLPQNVVCEIELVQQLGGVHNILPTIAVHRDMGAYVVMDYFPHDHFREVIKVMKYDEIIEYVQNLADSLDYLHSNGIVHRDVKPDNFLYHHESRRCALIDFGLSQRYNTNMDRAEQLKRRFSVAGPSGVPARKSSIQFTCLCEGKYVYPCSTCLTKPAMIVNKAGTPRFLAPEILLGSPKQTTKIDIWAVGMMVFYLISRQYPFFKARDSLAMVSELAALFGTKEFIETAKKHDMDLTTEFFFRKLNIPAFTFAHRNPSNIKNPAFHRYCAYCRSYFAFPDPPPSPLPFFCFCDHKTPRLEESEKAVVAKLARILSSCLQIDPVSRIDAAGLLELCKGGTTT